MKYFMLLLVMISIACSSDKLSNPIDLSRSDKISLTIDIKDNVKSSDISQLIEDIGYGKYDYKFNSPFSMQKTKIINLTIKSQDYQSVVDKLSRYSIVDSIEENLTLRMIDHGYLGSNDQNLIKPNTFIPNDPLYPDQWNMEMLDMKKAWDKSKGKGVVVAIVDTGVSDGLGKYAVVPDLEHTCILPGYNFVDNIADAYDDDGHGTHVAGTIAQTTNNNFGAVGIAPEACILPVKVLGSDGTGSWADVAEGIIWAVDNGAHVINLSIGAHLASPVVEKAVEYAYDKNVFLSCAAGNEKTNRLSYPAGYEGCHAISALDKSGGLAWYSNYGKSEEGQGIFLAAPGGDTRLTIKGGIVQNTINEGNPEEHGFFYFQGTSMAAPHVAGVAALIVSKIGAENMSVEVVEEVLAASTKHKFNKNKYGYGQLNASMAMDYVDDNLGFQSKLSNRVIITLLAIIFLYGIPLAYVRKSRNV